MYKYSNYFLTMHSFVYTLKECFPSDLHGNFHLETYHPDTSSNPEHLQMVTIFITIL